MVPSIAPILQRLTGEWATLLTDPNPEVVAQLTKLLASAPKLLQAIERGQGVLHALIYDKQGEGRQRLRRRGGQHERAIGQTAREG